MEPLTMSPPAAARPGFAATFDAVAMGVYPWIARAFGYTFRVGTDAALARDGGAVLRAVWSAMGVVPPPDTAPVAARFDAATTWIVAYHRGEPVGVMGLVDLRRAAVALELDQRAVPAGLDLARSRELGRLAILPGHRGGAQVVMVGLLREMLRWCTEAGVERLLSGSKPGLHRVFARYNPSVRLVDPPPAPPEDPLVTRYFAALRAYGARTVHYTFDVAGARPWDVFQRFVAGRLRREA